MKKNVLVFFLFLVDWFGEWCLHCIYWIHEKLNTSASTKPKKYLMNRKQHNERDRVSESAKRNGERRMNEHNSTTTKWMKRKNKWNEKKRELFNGKKHSRQHIHLVCVIKKRMRLVFANNPSNNFCKYSWREISFYYFWWWWFRLCFGQSPNQWISFLSSIILIIVIGQWNDTCEWYHIFLLIILLNLSIENETVCAAPFTKNWKI